MSIDFTKRIRNTFAANLLLAPVVGTLLAGVLIYKQPFLIIGRDIAGVPVVLYAFISTCIPAIVTTVFANFICRQLEKIDRMFGFVTWHLLGTSLGLFAGALVGLFLQRSVMMVLTGGLTGAVLGLVDSYIWWKGKNLVLSLHSRET
jgi:hypothetical protein